MFDTEALSSSLEAYGYYRAGRLLSDAQCRELVDAYGDDARYRSRIVMARHNFGGYRNTTVVNSYSSSSGRACSRNRS